MKIGSRMTGFFSREVGVEAFIEFCAQSGFDAVDLPTLTPELKAMCDKNKIGIGTSDNTVAVLIEDETERRKNMQQWKDNITAISDNGGKVMFAAVRPSQPMTRSAAFDLWKAVYPSLVAHAEAKGVKIAMEPWPGPAPHYSTLGCTPETLRAMFKEIPSPSLGLCYDPSHFVRIQVDYLRLLLEFGHKVVHVHLKDTEILEEGVYEYGVLGRTFGPTKHRFSEGWWRYTIPGKGLVDWNRVVNRLRDFNFEGVMSVELEDCYYTETPDMQKKGIVLSREHIVRCMNGV